MIIGLLRSSGEKLDVIAGVFPSTLEVWSGVELTSVQTPSSKGSLDNALNASEEEILRGSGR